MNQDLLKKKEVPIWCSWWAILLSTFIFVPVGIGLFFKRYHIDKSAGSVLAVIEIIFAILCFLVAYLGMLASLEMGMGSEDIQLIITFIVFGALLLYHSRRIRQRAKRYRLYLDMIINQDETYLPHIADSIPVSLPTLKKELQQLIKADYFSPGAHLSETHHEIILPYQEPIAYTQPSYATTSSATEPETREIGVISCPGCGASNSIKKGSTGECQYCGTPISGERDFFDKA